MPRPRPAPLREHAAADVAPGREHACRADEYDEGDRERDEWPPAVAAEGAHLLSPARSERATPARRSSSRKPLASRMAEHVPDAAHDEGETRGSRRQGRSRRAWSRRAAQRPLRRRRRRCRAPPSAIPAVNDPSVGCPATIPASPSSDSRATLAATVTIERCGQAGVPADDGGADELGAPVLLVLPRVPDDRERAHQRGEHREQQIAADHRRRALACARGDPEDTHRWSARRRCSASSSSASRSCPPIPANIPSVSRRKSEHVRGQLEAVAPQREPREPSRYPSSAFIARAPGPRSASRVATSSL